MTTGSKKALMLCGALVLVAIIASVVWYQLVPHTAEQQLEAARNFDSRNAALLGTLRGTSKIEDAHRADQLLAEMISRYGMVEKKFPGTPQVEDADHRTLELRDEATSDTAQKITLLEEFLKKYPKSARAADLKWRIATITQRDLRKPLDAIKLYRAFAEEFPKDERAPEALFRVAQIYEEIKEFAEARKAYEKVVQDYPKSKFADEAQFKVANLLAEKLEKKQEAEKAYEKLEKDYPTSRLSAAAGSERRKLSKEAAKSEGEKYKDDYYGGVREVQVYDRLAAELNSPLMKRLRLQPVNLVHEWINAAITPEEKLLSATVAMTLAVTGETTDALILQLNAPLDVATVTRGGRPAKFSRQQGFVLVDLAGQPMSAGSTETLELTYAGKNRDTWSGDMISTPSTYLLQKNWVPILDIGDSFSADIAVTVPEGYTAISQGVPQGEDTASSRTTFRFKQDRPVFFYSVVTAPYKVRGSEYKSKLPDAQPAETDLKVFLFKDTADEFFEAYIAEIPPVLDFFESKLGRFPYPKLAVAQVKYFPGGLGTPGLIYIGEIVFGKKAVPAAFFAHEVAHAWFGNELGLDLTEDSIPWLSEGFAQYWDALYLEHKKGHNEFVRHMRTLATNYYAAVVQISDKPIRTTLGDDPMYKFLAYEKGAFVLHALRGLLGDEKFFAMMRSYVNEHKMSIVTVEEFRKAAENAYGEPLGWFFEEWLDRAGIPRYRVNVAYQLPESKPGRYATQIEIEQVGAPFRMPVQVALETKAGVERKTLNISESFTTATIQSVAEPVKVTLDPDYWILKHPRVTEWEKPVTADRPETQRAKAATQTTETAVSKP
ncbi:MAG: tetratricopeptide repeat protein [Candidatus Sumerlaeaceae bacterium]|nr:tetratricopeptide repeat protein [Candidatus Sumerlaeaceae bacterium]